VNVKRDGVHLEGKPLGLTGPLELGRKEGVVLVLHLGCHLGLRLPVGQPHLGIVLALRLFVAIVADLSLLVSGPPCSLCHVPLLTPFRYRIPSPSGPAVRRRCGCFDAPRPSPQRSRSNRKAFSRPPSPRPSARQGALSSSWLSNANSASGATVQGAESLAGSSSFGFPVRPKILSPRAAASSRNPG